MEGSVRTAGKPFVNSLDLVGRVFVRVGVDFLVRELRCRAVEEGDELVLAVLRAVLSDHRAVQGPERGKQRDGAMPLAVVGACCGLASIPRQRSLGAAQRSDLLSRGIRCSMP